MKIKYIITTLLISSLAIICGCNSASASKPELVMIPGMTLVADTPAGKIEIEATNYLTRRYSWANFNKAFTHQIRDKRWLGSAGMYRPTGDSDMHAVLQEGQQHFYSAEEALAWLAWQKERMRWVYSSDGIVVGWNETKGKDIHALSVEVWQIYIQGKKPIGLQGANDEKIRVTFKNAPAFPQIGSFNPSSPKIIENRWYSGKAIDYMKEFDIPASKVEDVIKRGEKHSDGNYFWYHGWTLNPSINFSVCSDSGGKVWLVVP